MEKSKNLVQDFLLEKGVINPDNLMYNFFYEDVEWFVYKLAEDTIRYVSYELTPHFIGYAFCVTIKCSRFKYDISPVQYSKSFTNDTEGEWTKIDDKLKDKFLSDAMRDLQVWSK